MPIKVKRHQLEPDPRSNLSTYVSWTIIASVVTTFCYYLPIVIDRAQLNEIVEASNEIGTLHLVTISEPDQKPERFEISQAQAKILKLTQSKAKTCQIKASVINGIIPLFSERQILNIEFKDCQ